MKTSNQIRINAMRKVIYCLEGDVKCSMPSRHIALAFQVATETGNLEAQMFLKAVMRARYGQVIVLGI